jgi:glycosyltransferase involved in cell wall biosynthesis
LIKIISVVSNDIVTDNRVHKIAHSLVTNGYTVTIVGRRFKNSPVIQDRPYRTIRIKLLINKGPIFYFSLNLRMLLYLFFADCTFILANDLDTLPACFLAARLKRKKIVFDSHELFPEVPELAHRPLVRKIWMTMEKFLIPKIDLGFTVSSSIAEFYQKRYDMHFEVLRNVGRFRFDSEFKGAKKNAERIVIIYQGALNLGRGIELLIQSMQWVEKAELWIVGTGDIEKNIKQLVSKLSIDHKVIFTGRVAMEKIWAYTIRANIGISIEEDLGLNYRYALPNKLFDYIQARIPVIVSDLPEMKRIVEDYKIGKILQERTPQKLAEIINKMISEEIPGGKYNANVGLAARELCWEREEEKLINAMKLLSVRYIGSSGW